MSQRLTLAETLKYATQMADALAKALGPNRTCDLKPANIMIAGTAGWLLDFGLAGGRTGGGRRRWRPGPSQMETIPPKGRSSAALIHIPGNRPREEGERALRYLLFQVWSLRNGHGPPREAPTKLATLSAILRQSRGG
jgi:hypothetical protein